VIASLLHGTECAGEEDERVCDGRPMKIKGLGDHVPAEFGPFSGDGFVAVGGRRALDRLL
jgi:hypothetical protein